MKIPVSSKKTVADFGTQEEPADPKLSSTGQVHCQKWQSSRLWVFYAIVIKWKRLFEKNTAGVSVLLYSVPESSEDSDSTIYLVFRVFYQK